jgi:hypothetical protein
LEEKTMSDLLNLHKLSIKDVNKIIKVPGIEEFKTENITLFAVKYFIYSSQNKAPLILRITSLRKSFDYVYSLDFLNQKMNPIGGFVISNKMTMEKFIEFFKDIASTTKVAKIKESLNIREEFSLFLKGDFILEDAEEARAFIREYMKWLGIMTGIVTILGLISKYQYYFIKLKNWIYEKYVSGPIEQKINEKLFQGQQADESAFKIYQKLINFIKYTLRERAPAFLICGPPGTSKTYIVRRTLHFEGYKPRIDYVIEKGASLGIRDFFSLLYYNRKKTIILDDFDSPLRNEDTINLLKSITDSYERRIVSLPREKILGSAEAPGQSPSVPQKFEFTGKLIIVTNLTRKDVNTALLSRIPTFEVYYNMKEVIENLKLMLHYINSDIPIEKKQEVYDYILELYEKDEFINLDFRTFRSCVEVRVGNPDGWKDMVKIILNYKGK